MTRGYRWQEVLGHRVELAAVPAAGDGSAYWDSAQWGSATWGAGWPPAFTDVTRACLSIHSSTGAQGLDLASGVGSLELELLDLEGDLAPGGSVDWLLGLQVRLWTVPLDQAEHPAWYGVIDKAVAGGTFAVPVVAITAYDTRSMVAAASTQALVANQAERADVRLAAILEAARIPEQAVSIEADPSPLLPDETTDLGDLFGRTIESVGGIAWADGAGRVVTRNRGWTSGQDGQAVALYVYAGQPPGTVPAGIAVAQTTDLGASQAIDTVRNVVTFANFADPPVEVIRSDAASITRYGLRSSRTTDLACDQSALELLAARTLELHREPILVCEGATVTVYDAATARAAGLELGDLIVIGRNDPDGAVWEMTGLVTGIDLDLTADSAEVALTVLEVAGIAAGGAGTWDTAHWDQNRWGTRPSAGTFTLGPSSADELDRGYVLK